AEAGEVVGRDLLQQTGLGDLHAGGVVVDVFAEEADRPTPEPLLDDLRQALERAAADEQDVRGVDLHGVLVGQALLALGLDARDRALEELEQRLLHALAADVAADAAGERLAGELV